MDCMSKLGSDHVIFHVIKRTEMKFQCRIKINAYKCQNPVKKSKLRQNGKYNILFCCTPWKPHWRFTWKRKIQLILTTVSYHQSKILFWKVKLFTCLKVSYNNTNKQTGDPVHHQDKSFFLFLLLLNFLWLCVCGKYTDHITALL